MKLLFFGTLSSLVFLSVACEKKPKQEGPEEFVFPIENNTFYRFAYKNDLNIPVEVDYYWDMDRGYEKVMTKTIRPGEVMMETYIDFYGWYKPLANGKWSRIKTAIMDCSLVRFVFDGKKELWHSYLTGYFNGIEIEIASNYFNEDSVLNLSNYTYDEYEPPFKPAYTYTISQDIYDLATEIVVGE